MSKWMKCTLGDIITFQRGYDLTKSKMIFGQYPVIASNGIIGWHNEYTTETPSITVGRSGNVGNPFLYNGRSWSHNTTLYIKEYKNCDKLFIYYLLKELNLKNYSSGSAVPTLNRNHIHNLEILVPLLKEQQKISKILSSLDEKIEINRKINENLEEQAKEIFLENFVRNEKNYTNWEKVSLIDIANYLNGLAMQKYRPKENEESLPVLKIKELRQGVTDKGSELCSCNIDSNYIINNGDIIFSWSGSLLVDIWCGGTCGLNQHLFKVTSDKYEKWFYYLWTKYHLDEFILIAKDKATTMGHIKRENLKNAQVLIPSDEEYKKLTLILKPMIDLIIDIKIQIQKLSSIRDELLPKLMTGEIDVSKIDI